MHQTPSLEELQQQIRVFCDERNWGQAHNPKDLSISLVLEATEVMEHFQWKDHKEMADHVVKHRADISDELADVFYWILLLADKLDVNLIEAFQRKMKQNEQKYPVAIAKDTHKKYSEL